MCGEAFSVLRLMEMGCCGCFGLSMKSHRSSIGGGGGARSRVSQEYSLEEGTDDDDRLLYNGDSMYTLPDCGSPLERPIEGSAEVLRRWAQSGPICREVPVKETREVTRREDENGNKMVNEYIREYKIGSGSYGKVVLYRSSKDEKHYAVKVFHKSHLSKLRVAPSETAMTDVLREVSIMKMLDHPNIVNLIEVIDDPNADHFYMVMEYVDGKRVSESSTPRRGIDECTSRRYLRDIVSGLIYLHSHNIIHGDIKPDNLLVTSKGKVKIGDFSVSQVFEDDNDLLRRSPGTPVFTAPECCLGLTYHGKTADTWAVGVTLYFMVVGSYPFLGETLQDTYDKIVNNPLVLPGCINRQLRNLMEGLLCKDPMQRMSLRSVAEHPWVIAEEGPVPEFQCKCRRDANFRGEFGREGEELVNGKRHLISID